MTTQWLNEVLSDKKTPGNKYVKYIAWAGEVEFQGASESDRAGRKVKLRLVRPPEDQSKVHPFAKFTRRRRGYTGTRFEASFSEIDGPREFMIETALDNWTDSPKGSMLSLALTMEDDRHPFMSSSRGDKDERGSRYMVVFIEKNDDDSLVHQERRERAERAARTGRSQTLSNVARIMTKHPRFHDWLYETQPPPPELWRTAPAERTKQADDWLKSEIGIESKAELDDDRTPESGARIVRFHKIRQRFIDWQEAQGDDLIDR